MSGDVVRLTLEDRENNLSPFAARSKFSRRDRDEVPSDVRTEFQRDRDRIIHTNAFRRLKHKTQVFIAPPGDHYVTRLTHTLEVSQIARTIARALNLNEDLTEAVSLGHDLGHTPFGHAGEEVLNEVYPQGFRHNEQSLRVVEVLEKDGRGLNLTAEVREGILKHSKSRRGLMGGDWDAPDSFEGQICKLADSIAYVNHDIGDALRAGIIAAADLPREAVCVLGDSHSKRIDTLVKDVIGNSWSVTGCFGNCKGFPQITMSAQVLEAMNVMRSYLFDNVYDRISRGQETLRARDVVRRLYQYFVENPSKIPADFARLEGGTERVVVDYIAGMTDQYALNLAEEVCG